MAGASMNGLRSAALRAAAAAAVVCGVDQAVKVVVRSQMEVGAVHDLLGPFSIVSVRNDGVAFGAFAGAGALLIAVIALALTALLVVFLRTGDRPGVWLAAGAIFGGAAGNVIDRVAFGAVTDYLKVSRWPAFNIADLAIVLGAIGLVFLTERGGPLDLPEPEA